MEDLKVCRVCLYVDVKLYNILTSPLRDFFHTIMGNKYGTDMPSLPHYLCYECAALMKKFSEFKDRCMHAESFLYQIYKLQGKIIEEDIRKINRNEQNLKLNLSVHRNTEDTIIDVVHRESVEQKYSVKEELVDIDVNEYLVVKQDEGEDVEAQSDGMEYDRTLSSDDDEPLAFHKRNKEREEENTEDFEFEDIEVALEVELPKEIKDLVQPRKRGRPPKSNKKIKPRKPARVPDVDNEDGMDLEDFVNIIHLTPDQQIEEIEERKNTTNYLNSQFKCNLCFKGFIDANAWKHHLTKHDPSAGDVVCPICKFRFKEKRGLQKHSVIHEKKYACKSCSYVSRTSTQAKQHQRWHKGVTYKCKYCGDISSKWTSYLSHVRIKHPSEFVCNVCGYSFVSKLGLTMHKSMMHKDSKETENVETDEKESGPYCKECDVKFACTEAWKRHMVTSAKHTMDTEFKNGCRVCGETFSNAEELRLHHRKQHAKKRPKNYGKTQEKMSWPAKCEHCSEEIENPREYWTHFRRFHPDQNYPIQRNYVCDICGKSYRGNAFLMYHKRTHTEERAFRCTQCPKAFFNRTNLLLHEKTHSDIRPYPCTACFKAFKCKAALDRHFRSHTGVKPYVCEFCGKAFGQSNSRKLHVRTVHLKQPAPYVSRSRLERRNKHQQEEQIFGF